MSESLVQKNRSTKPDRSSTNITLDPTKSLPEKLESIEKKLILDALEQTGGQIAAAARLLSISKQRLMYKINKYSIR